MIVISSIVTRNYCANKSYEISTHRWTLDKLRAVNSPWLSFTQQEPQLSQMCRNPSLVIHVADLQMVLSPWTCPNAQLFRPTIDAFTTSMNPRMDLANIRWDVVYFVVDELLDIQPFLELPLEVFSGSCKHFQMDKQ